MGKLDSGKAILEEDVTNVLKNLDARDEKGHSLRDTLEVLCPGASSRLKTADGFFKDWKTSRSGESAAMGFDELYNLARGTEIPLISPVVRAIFKGYQGAGWQTLGGQFDRNEQEVKSDLAKEVTFELGDIVSVKGKKLPAPRPGTLAQQQFETNARSAFLKIKGPG